MRVPESLGQAFFVKSGTHVFSLDVIEGFVVLPDYGHQEYTQDLSVVNGSQKSPWTLFALLHFHHGIDDLSERV